jgi:hypothetical protein
MKNIRLMQRLLIIMGLVIVILSLGTCYGVMKEKANTAEISDLQSELLATDQRFIERIKDDSTREYSQRQLIADKDIAIKLLADEAKRYRKIKSVTKTKLIYETDTVFAKYTEHDTIYKLMGREFCSETQYDTICGKIDSLGVVIYPHTTYIGEMTTVIANEKSGFLKLKSKPVVNVSFSNPNVRIAGISNVVVKQPKPKRLGWLISGIAIGITGGILLMAN